MTKLSRFATLATCLMVAAVVSLTAQEVIDATAMGTSTQLGKNVSVKLIIERWSTKEEQQTLTQAFHNDQIHQLYDDLDKTSPVVQILIPGTLGYTRYLN